jgi:hypothetical protein
MKLNIENKRQNPFLFSSFCLKQFDQIKFLEKCSKADPRSQFSHFFQNKINLNYYFSNFYTSRPMVLGYNVIQWKNGSGGLGGYTRIFSCHSVGNAAQSGKKIPAE